MASACLSSCVDDVRVPVRASYVNKWPESDFEFVRSMSSKTRRAPKKSVYGQPRVVDSISCRQLYLRSYTFSRDDDDDGIKCLGNNTIKDSRKELRKSGGGDGGGLKKVKAVSCSALASIFRGLMSCTTKVDVAK